MTATTDAAPDAEDGLFHIEAPPPVSLQDRFGVPPFSVLDRRAGYWKERKRRWLSLGIISELGRDPGLLGGAMPPGGRALSMGNAILGNGGIGGIAGVSFKEQARRSAQGETSKDMGNGVTRVRSGAYGAQATTDADGNLVYEVTTGATSIFDPVLCELAYRWHTAPGDHVLDPFAGGSVRGLIASIFDLDYTGLELRTEQVEANREQLHILDPYHPPRLVPPRDNTPPLTPIEQVGSVWVKRDDTYRRAGQHGGKVRTCHFLATAGGTPEGLITASSRHSPQALIVAHLAAQLGIGARLHMPEGEWTDEMRTCAAAGAEIIQHKAGYNSVIVARAREDAEAHPTWRHIPFGMECAEAVEQTATQAASLTPEHLPFGAYGIKRIVIPVGSGMSLAGLLTGMADRGITIPVVGVVVGADPTKRLDTYAPEGWRDMVTLVQSALSYDQRPEVTTLGDLHLDPVYEAKCLAYLEPGDLLWVVGTRAQAPGTSVRDRTPRWVQGDSRTTLPTLRARPADFVFSCPPYADLEVYSDDPADLSAMPYPEFLAAYRQIIADACAHLRNDRFAAWVISDVRDKKGAYRGLVADTIRAFTDAGLTYHTDAIIIDPVGSAAVRAAKPFTSSRKLARMHQHMLVFCKGSAKAATARLAPPTDLELTEPEPTTE